jgi:hypothetical protein
VADSIEANVETADIAVAEGTQQLSQASKYQVLHCATVLHHAIEKLIHLCLIIL